MSYPTPDTVSDWDDASLFATAGCEAALRYGEHGFESLNDEERSFCCLYQLEADVNNGGFSQWLWNLCPAAAVETPLVLQRIGATEMASFVADALVTLGDMTRFKSKDEWLDELLDPRLEEVHEHLQALTPRFLQLEHEFLERAYAYTRTNWRKVRPLPSSDAPDQAQLHMVRDVLADHPVSALPRQHPALRTRVVVAVCAIGAGIALWLAGYRFMSAVAPVIIYALFGRGTGGGVPESATDNTPSDRHACPRR